MKSENNTKELICTDKDTGYIHDITRTRKHVICLKIRTQTCQETCQGHIECKMYLQYRGLLWIHIKGNSIISIKLTTILYSYEYRNYQSAYKYTSIIRLWKFTMGRVLKDFNFLTCSYHVPRVSPTCPRVTPLCLSKSNIIRKLENYLGMSNTCRMSVVLWGRQTCLCFLAKQNMVGGFVIMCINLALAIMTEKCYT